jgi:hypothetical protein
VYIQDGWQRDQEWKDSEKNWGKTRQREPTTARPYDGGDRNMVEGDYDSEDYDSQLEEEDGV